MYEWVLAAHVISIIAWMAGLLYLPRLMVYHVASEVGSVQSETFKTMERRLLRAIMTPAMVASWIFGLWLMVLLEAWRDGWFMVKFLAVLGLTGFHMACARWVRELSQDGRERNQRFYRFMNEVPTIAMIVIVVMAIVKPL